MRLSTALAEEICDLRFCGPVAMKRLPVGGEGEGRLGEMAEVGRRRPESQGEIKGGDMEGWRKIGEELERYLRVPTFPVAVRFLQPGEQPPEKARRPLAELGQPIALCQALTLSRRMGWTVAVGPEDSSCPLANLTMGWLEEMDLSLVLGFFQAMNYARDEAAARARVDGLGKLPTESYNMLVLSPLARTRIEPHMILVFGNPAQIMRVVQAVSRWEGQKVPGAFGGLGGSCNEGIILAFQEDKPRVVLPGNGDRVFAATQDDEMAIAFPASWAERVLEGLEATASRGVRYPIPHSLQYELPFARLMQRFSKER